MASSVSHFQPLSCWNLRPLLSSSFSSSSCSPLPPAFPLPSLSAFCSPPFHGFTSRKHSPLHAVADVAADPQQPAPPAPADDLAMIFKAEGTLADSSIPKVTEALKNVQGVSSIKVFTAEGISTVELTKQTSIQATGEGSSLVELIRGQGFKLQNLCISFDDADSDGNDDIVYEYENSDSTS